ncbi:hypothetical protein Q427_12055 [Halomonas sp. BC04]|nr:hypothetical protein Q427_12055 [Halomonas sp. BC04]
MRLIRELCAERKLAAIINIHDVALARQFADRIVGLRAGEIVFDGAPGELTAENLTTIYGEEDWDTQAAEEESPAAIPSRSSAEATPLTPRLTSSLAPNLAKGGAR